MSAIRSPAVAGTFYPANPERLHATVSRLLAESHGTGPLPKAIIAPHAGYIYSGAVAASAYSLLEPARGVVSRVVLLGPAHRVPFHGLALADVEAFGSPLGPVSIDRDAVKAVSRLPQVRVLDRAHALEHSLEVHLPFLQEVLGTFALVPLAVGDASPREVGEVLEALWGGPETLIVISSDLSHYHDYETAKRLDGATARSIEQLRFEEIDYDAACGRDPINGLLWVARRKGLEARRVDLRNSGDTAGSREEVVGYGAFVFGEKRMT